MKYYAIKEGKGVTDKIVDTWEECKKFVHGYPAVYKSFYSMDEAVEYLRQFKNKAAVEKAKKKAIEGIKISREKKAEQKVKPKDTIIKVKISADISEAFYDKCQNLQMSPEKLIENLIREYID